MKESLEYVYNNPTRFKIFPCKFCNRKIIVDRKKNIENPFRICKKCGYAISVDDEDNIIMEKFFVGKEDKFFEVPFFRYARNLYFLT